MEGSIDMRRTLAAAFSGATLFAAALASPAVANDHLANATAASGGNPVTTNPSGVSGANARPGSVPGQGNPNAGQDTTVPASDLGCVFVRTGATPDPSDTTC
jgi:hypothetical protein